MYEQDYLAFGQPQRSQVVLCAKHAQRANERLAENPVAGRGRLTVARILTRRRP
jgi:hypothetical protein